MAKINLTQNNSAENICSVEKCEAAAKKRTFCLRHYHQFIRNGIISRKTYKSKSLSERFWEKVDKTTSKNDCWLWTGCTDFGGYGKISYKLKSRKATHIVLFLINGVFPALDVLHSCDNPICVNPAHLHEGTHAENMKEGVARNRFPQGEKRNFAKLKNPQVLEIKNRIDMGEKLSTLAVEFQVSYTTIMRIGNGSTWKSVLD